MTTAPASDWAPADITPCLDRDLDEASLPVLVAAVIDQLADAIDTGLVPEGVSTQQWLRTQAESLRATGEEIDKDQAPADEHPQPRYPHVRVRLAGEDGNAMSIVGRVGNALRSAGVDSSTREEFANEAFSGDYAHLLHTVRDWVTVADGGFGD